MGTASELPLDILGCIADVLGNFHKLRSQNRQAVKDLQMLCLTCKSMVPICRRHLFAHIEFIHTGSHWWYNGLNEFLLSHPTIATHYLKSLHIRVTDEFSALDYELLQKIRLNSSALTSIKILSDLCCWDDLSNRVKSVVYSLIQMPTLRHLTLNCIENFPAAALQSLCIGLKELTFHDSCSLAPPVSGDDAMQNPTITTLAFEQTYSSYNITFSSLTKPIGQNTVFAFDRVKNIYANIPDQAEGFDACKVLERAICLEHLELSGEFHALTVKCAYPDILLNS
ncbi:hypothetical protein HYPSUDRAFT_1025308 [Hypholoma sublateritium FD-334 SS-4]|uniref:F-box domain-containing protein n=1 Tax=Hypholoma sublateritium (strain FD-334 SS-4) TaxID=945553 RepID=A0A0D2KRK5_HYPSF|nr:hypothetical protein HYPSUDRAFT_1025308 [Hypholoma sublateritium FD-334 SS-4]